MASSLRFQLSSSSSMPMTLAADDSSWMFYVGLTPTWQQLKVNLRVNLMGYDYSGYGASAGKPSESNTYADIEAVYQCLQTEYGVSQEDLILYGQSVGSGPTLHLASKLPRLRGVVLHSGILSGLRVLCHVKFTFCCDIYKNINKIKKVKCPVLVIHGTGRLMLVELLAWK
ncbi:hypothetical protein CUMW_179780 [Citrus unshiu]|uniref:Serine aminopeptidase S33 domain-containing protein n=1 Tax=Citrus unshiu TaxID=55188 RepID=A0A2H5PYS5_CITUN|nr:hypothetical protein CUMW_179780 [Citrus unshiu]